MPRTFRHEPCGTVTELPATVLATILRDPHLVADTTRCAHCKKLVPFSECVWVETGQDLQSFLDELRAESAEEWTDTYEWPDETEELPRGADD
ncbi:MAG: hypothetical protein AAF602_25730 [Myxococcota bacterium]